MPKGFGGSSDFSGFFSGVYSYNKDNAKAQQAASDQDASDRWANGLMSDQEWLAYIDQRVTATSGDPKEHQKWVTAQRKYARVVADNVAESAYKEGGSINDLIAHYQNRQAGMTPDSNESRELMVRINDLLDQRAGEGLQDKADAMLININKGTQTYGDLAKLLREGIGAARDNSDLKASLEKQLKSVNEQIRSNKVEGAFEKLQYRYDAGSLSAGSYAKALRQMAVQFKDNDPKRYYQILGAASKLAQSGGSGGGGGGGGGRSGGGGGSSSGSRRAAAKTIDALQAQRNQAYTLIDAYERGATTYEGVHLTPAKIHELDLQVLKTHDQLAAAYIAKGDKSAAGTTEISKAKYLTDVIVKHNTMPADEASRVLMNTTVRRVESALENPDPTRSMAELRVIASDWEKFATGTAKYTTVATNVKRSGALEYGDNYKKGDTIVGGNRKAVDKIDASRTVAASSFASVLRLLTKPGVTEEEVGAALASLGEVGPAGHMNASAFSQIAARALEIPARKEGLDTGELSRVATSKGLEWIRTTMQSVSTIGPDGRQVIVQKPVPDISINGQSQKLTDIYMDINGHPTKVQAVAELSSVDGLNGWKTTSAIKHGGLSIPKGSFLTKTQIAKLTAAGFDPSKLEAQGKLERSGVQPYWKVTTPPYTDKYGRVVKGEVWAQDVATNLWYKGGLPLRLNPTADGMVDIDDEGNPNVGWQPYASAGGVPAIYAGGNAKDMQTLYSSGLLDVGNIRGRDGMGRVTEAPNGRDLLYWDPRDPAGKDDSDSWWDPAKRKKMSDDLRQADVRRVMSSKTKDDFFGTKPPGTQPGDPMAAFHAMGKSFGINLEGTKLPNRAEEAEARRSTRPVFDPMAATGRNVLGGPTKKADLPVVKLPTKPSFSGPTIKQGATVGLDLAPRKQASAPKVKNASGSPDDRDKPAAKTPAKKTTTPVIKNGFVVGQKAAPVVKKKAAPLPNRYNGAGR